MNCIPCNTLVISLQCITIRKPHLKINCWMTLIGLLKDPLHITGAAKPESLEEIYGNMYDVILNRF